jgi:oligopeptide/dipeptide ABC transporter ATP-binding protein
LCNRVTVLYGGEVMESAPVADLYHRPLHPYTAGLLASLPRRTSGTETRLSTIGGVAPSLSERLQGCVFAPRCPVAVAKCFDIKPSLDDAEHGRQVRYPLADIAHGELALQIAPRRSLSASAARVACWRRGVHKRYGNVRCSTALADASRSSSTQWMTCRCAFGTFHAGTRRQWKRQTTWRAASSPWNLPTVA